MKCNKSRINKGILLFPSKYLEKRIAIIHSTNQLHTQLAHLIHREPHLTLRNMSEVIAKRTVSHQTCQAQSRKSRNTGDSWRSFEMANADLAQRSPNGWPACSHSRSSRASNLHHGDTNRSRGNLLLRKSFWPSRLLESYKWQWWANLNHDWDLNRDLGVFGSYLTV